jgi:hypothetical protein
MVQQYSRLADKQLSAQFDSRAIRKALDAAGLPIWGQDRPLVAVWLAVDSGNGRRVLLPAGGSSADRVDRIDELRAVLTESADRRGLPVVLPLVDAEDLSIVNFADIWGDFRAPVLAATERYGAEAILLWRARSLDPQDDRVRWSLTMGAEHISWEGDIAAGPARAADYLAQRLATFAGAADSLRVLVKNVDTLDKYGQLKGYLEGLPIVERAAIIRVNGTELEFDLVVRGDQQRLERELNRGRLLQPASSETDGLEFGRLPDLVYTWADGA